MRLFAPRPEVAAADGLYRAIVDQARAPAFFTAGGVPDTLDGRFEMIALHAYAVLRRLKADHDRTRALAQALFDAMFADMDRCLREMGAGDLGVGRRVKTMASAFYGRISAYDRGLSEGPDALADALARNLYGTVEPDPAAAASMAGYLLALTEWLDEQPVERMLEGELAFGPARLA